MSKKKYFIYNIFFQVKDSFEPPKAYVELPLNLRSQALVGRGRRRKYKSLVAI